MTPLDSTANQFGGVLPSPDGLPADPDRFRDILRGSLKAWRADGFQVVWLEIPADRAGLIPVAVDERFHFHHTGAEYLMLTHRLAEDATIPPYASHFIGAGGVVVNEARELLVVSERRGRRTQTPYYKLPGGAMHEGEHLVEGVIREVSEETGVQTRFEALICLRNLHGYRYGKSDIYFVCRLAPLSRQISMQEEEIEECLWMPLEEYMQAETVGEFNKRIVMAAIESPGLVVREIDSYRDPGTYEIFMPREPALDGIPGDSTGFRLSLESDGRGAAS